jgi:ubiquinol-cytochrome c reductase cytochrome c subunit
MRKNVLVAAGVAGMMMLGAGAAFAGDAQKGSATFREKGCWQCHGYEGQGGAAGPRLANTQLPEDGLIVFVHNTAAAMPPYSEKLISDEQLSDIYAYLQSRPKPADPKTIPLLQR